ncbi:PREDICTED: inactive protein kinase SELMODRAFT_444075-like [Tarenaya hassleriana]|uniref:inactive protein kinase SELMODRAFT_444075-like n=1 Tax=Tarenaya hassleriana TaxID=28532 RepID=UPI00053C0CF0|nr:PREDICTED: inactive protein kinase SELMODRAFT_444075-like [Tarenaya hassleriana]
MLAAAVEARLNRRDGGATTAERILVAVKAERVISKTALAWALNHVVHAGDCVTLLAIFPGEKSGRRFWNFSILNGDCGSSHRENLPDRIFQISESCSQMVLQIQDQREVKVRIKVVSCSSGDAVAAEARRNRASWVIVDKKLKRELRQCIEELRCNIVVVKGSQAKVLRLNLQASNGTETPYFSASSSPDGGMGGLQAPRVRNCTPVSSPEEPSTSPSRILRENSRSSLDTISPPFLLYEQNPLFEVATHKRYASVDDIIHTHGLSAVLDSDQRKPVTLSTSPGRYAGNNDRSVFWIPQNHDQVPDEKPVSNEHNSSKKLRPEISKTLLEKFIQCDTESSGSLIMPKLGQSHMENFVVKPDGKILVSLNRASSTPPPLCSFCQSKAPAFGKPPKRFSYEALAEATDGFSDSNLLAEGGFGIVYRGVLRNGQSVAVKILKISGSQVDADFCREVRLLSCAQHKNVVLLIGYCTDGNNRVLVYEYVCNGSLDFNLHGNKQQSLDWDSRMKIAIGAARGLRYLHEDCRVGSIVHRDLRPHNILLTHDFEPLVADFGLARWFTDCSIGPEERVIGTSGYLAPEYVDGGTISEKVDVYAFGLVLLELITGRRACELQCYKDQLFPSDWLHHPFNYFEPNRVLEKVHQLLDPRLRFAEVDNFTHQLHAVSFAASSCLRRDPDSRPTMSKVLRTLEGAGCMPLPLAFDLNSAGNRSGRLVGLSSNKRLESSGNHTRTLSH